MSVPAYIRASQVARACECSRRAAIFLLRGAGILERNGGRWKVGESRLGEALPDVYDRVFLSFEPGGANDSERHQTTLNGTSG
jgi:hypothetical protein